MLSLSSRDFLPLVLLDGDFNLPQNLFGDCAEGPAEHVHGVRRVEIEYRLKVLIFNVFAGVNPAAGHERVGCADREGFPEADAYVEVIKFI
jgi:hypothetical protein